MGGLSGDDQPPPRMVPIHVVIVFNNRKSYLGRNGVVVLSIRKPVITTQ